MIRLRGPRPPAAVLLRVVGEDGADPDRFDEPVELGERRSLEALLGGVEVPGELLVGELVLEDVGPPAVDRGREVRGSGEGVWVRTLASATVAAKGFTARQTSRTARRISVSVAIASMSSRAGRTPCWS